MGKARARKAPATGVINIRDRVKIVRSDDETRPRGWMRKSGMVIGRIVNDHGATPKDPLLVVRRDDGEEDAFWETELRMEKRA